MDVVGVELSNTLVDVLKEEGHGVLFLKDNLLVSSLEERVQCSCVNLGRTRL